MCMVKLALRVNSFSHRLHLYILIPINGRILIEGGVAGSRKPILILSQWKKCECDEIAMLLMEVCRGHWIELNFPFLPILSSWNFLTEIMWRVFGVLHPFWKKSAKQYLTPPLSKLLKWIEREYVFKKTKKNRIVKKCEKWKCYNKTKVRDSRDVPWGRGGEGGEREMMSGWWGPVASILGPVGEKGSSDGLDFSCGWAGAD